MLLPCSYLSHNVKMSNENDRFVLLYKRLIGEEIKSIVSQCPPTHQWWWTVFLRVPDCWLLVVVGMDPVSGWQQEVCHSSIKISSPTPDPQSAGKWRKLYFVGSQSYLLTISFIWTKITRLNDVFQGLCSASLELCSFFFKSSSFKSYTYLFLLSYHELLMMSKNIKLHVSVSVRTLQNLKLVDPILLATRSMQAQC